MSGQSSQITAQVSINGQTINVKTIEVCLTKTKKSETFRATVAMYDPAAQGLVDAAGSNATVTINNQLVGGTFILEHPEYEFGETTITLSGRDAASAKLIDGQNTSTFTNQQPQQVVQSLAQGVPVDADSATPTAGKIFQIDHNAITHRGSPWTAIQKLADINGMNAYITGGTLYWKNVDEQLPSYQLNYSPPSPQGYATCNVLMLKCHRNGQMSKECNVTVKTHHPKQKKTYSSNSKSGGSVDGSLNYNYVVASATPDQIDNFSKKKSKEHAKHAFDILFEILGDLSLTPRMSVQLNGTNTSFDTNYDIQDVKHKVDIGGGFTTSVTGKTASGGGKGAAQADSDS